MLKILYNERNVQETPSSKHCHKPEEWSNVINAGSYATDPKSVMMLTESPLGQE
jgi:hypothetical protein